MNFLERFLKRLIGEFPEVRECVSCNLLKEQLDFANYDRKVLLETVIRLNLPKPESNQIPIEVNDMMPIRTSRFNSPGLRRREAEKKSRELSLNAQEMQIQVSSLEKELLGESNGIKQAVSENG